MKTKITLSPKVVPIIFFLIFSSILIYPQSSKHIKSNSSGKKYDYVERHSGNSNVSSPSDVSFNKRKTSNINRREFNRKNNRTNVNKRDYSENRNKESFDSDNYFHIDKSGNTLWDGKHWDEDEFPLKVYVKESSSEYYKSSYKEYVEYAFDVWNKADNRIKYTFTNNSRDADIELIFIEDLGKKYEENYLGLTEYDVDRRNEIDHSKIQISLIKFGKDKISDGEIKATIIHEIGHAFGLGHSENESDIMYPYISSDHSAKMTYDELSNGDKEAIQDAIDLGSDQYVRK
ncbi:MAG TPA: matrixin family metalloprotease [Ignavibacteriaceae bacterium]|jgi:hypothetical protein